MFFEESSNSKLWNQIDWSKINPPEPRKLENSTNTFNLDIPPIPKLNNPNIHYRCPKCYNFPLISFLNEEYISYNS